MIKKHKVLLYFVALLVLMNVLNFVIILALDYFHFLTYNQENLLLLICVPLTYIIAILLTVKWFNVNFEFKFEPCNSNVFFNALVLVLFVYILQVAIDKPFLESISQGKLRFLTTRTPLQGDLNTNIFTILSIFIGPVLEEILYRRIIYRKLAEQYSIPSSILITSLLFAIMHQSIEGFLAYFFVGFVYTYLYHLTRSLWLNVLVHGLYNLFVSVTAITTYQSTDSFFFIGLLIYVTCATGVFISLKRLKVLTS